MYTSKVQLEKRLTPQHLIELSDDDGDGVADDDVVDQAIADADAMIDAYLRSRYVVPFATVPSIIESISAVIAINNLFSRRRETVSPEHQMRYEKAVELLDNIFRGMIDIGDSPDVTEKTLLRSSDLNEGKVFSEDSLEEF